MGRAGGSGGSRSGGASRHSTGSRSASSSRSNSSLSNRPPRSYSGGGFGSNRSGFSHNPYSPPPPPPPRPRYRPQFSTRYTSPTYLNRTTFNNYISSQLPFYGDQNHNSKHRCHHSSYGFGQDPDVLFKTGNTADIIAVFIVC